MDDYKIIVEQESADHVVDVDDLVGDEGYTAHDEQHRTGVLRDFEARVFHRIFPFVDSTKVRKKGETAKLFLGKYDKRTLLFLLLFTAEGAGALLYITENSFVTREQSRVLFSFSKPI